METVCPHCGTPLTVEERDALTIADCPACGWSGGSVGDPNFNEMPRSSQVSVFVRAAHPLPLEALRRLRELLEKAASAPLTELKSILAQGISLGPHAPYKATELREILEPLGFQVICTEHVNET